MGGLGAGAGGAFGLHLRVDLAADGLHGLVDLVGGGLHLLRGGARVFEDLLAFGDGGLGRGLLVGRALVAEVLEELLGLVDRLVEDVLRLDGLALLLVVGGVGFGFLAEALDLVLGKAGRAGYRDLLVAAGAEVLGGDVEDAVGVDVEGDLDLRGAARGRRDAVEAEVAEQLVVAGHRALALEDLDVDGGLAVGIGREHLRLLGRDGGVARDHRRGDGAGGLDAEGERGDVEEDDVVLLTGEDCALDGGADGDDLIGVHATVGVLAGEAVGDLDDRGHAGHAADEDELVDLVLVEAGVLQARFERSDGALGEAFAKLLELGAREGDGKVLRAGGVGGDEGEIDVVALGGGEGDLGLLGLFLEALHRHGVATEVDAGLLFEGISEPVDDGVVPVVAAEVGVAIGGADLEDAVAELEDGDVVGAAAEIVHGDGLVLLLV